MKITRKRGCFPGTSMENVKTGGKLCCLLRPLFRVKFYGAEEARLPPLFVSFHRHLKKSAGITIPIAKTTA